MNFIEIKLKFYSSQVVDRNYQNFDKFGLLLQELKYLKVEEIWYLIEINLVSNFCNLIINKPF